MRKRRSVDWEMEIRKTKEIQKKGFRISLLSFLIAMAFIGGINLYSPGANAGKLILPSIFAVSALLVVIWVIRRKKR